MRLSILVWLISLGILSVSCSSSDIWIHHYQGDLRKYVKRTYQLANLDYIQYHIATSKSNTDIIYYFVKQNDSLYFRKYDFVNEKIYERALPQYVYDTLLKSLKWLKNDKQFIDLNPIVWDLYHDYGMEYQIIMRIDKAEYDAIIYNESDSKTKAKEHDASVNLFKSILYDTELFPELYDKVRDFKDEIPVDSIYKAYKKRW